MKNITKFLIVSGLTALVGPAFLTACAGNIGTCTSDTECGAGQTCDLATSTCVGGGEGEGEGEGAGEGEGEGGACDTTSFADPAGDGGITLSGCTLDNDAANTASCTNAATAYTITCDENGYTSVGDCSSANGCSGNEVQFSSGDQPPTPDPSFCSSFPAESGGFIVCPVCFDNVPADLSVQYDDDSATTTGGVSAATCVDTSGAT